MFVGNLSYEVTREELLEVFAAAGTVVDAKVPVDRETGRPRGFAFVEFDSEEAAQKAISVLHGKDLRGRPLRVNEAENRPPRPAFGGPPGPRDRGAGPGPGGPGFRRARPFEAPSFDGPPPDSRDGRRDRGRAWGKDKKREPRRRRFDQDE